MELEKLRKREEIKVIKKVVSALVLTIFFHTLVIFNKTYSVNQKKYSSEDYKLLLDKAESGLHYHIVYNTKVSYFHILPLWTPYIFYTLYFAAIIWGLIIFNKKDA